MDPNAARTRVQRRRNTMLKLLLGNRDEEVDTSTFEPENGERVRTIAPCLALQKVLMVPWRSST